MSRSWLSIRVELVEGRGEDYWPRPGRMFAAARTHTFGQLATAIDDAFARWDRAHLHQFWMTDVPRIGRPDIEEDVDDYMLDERRVTSAGSSPVSSSPTSIVGHPVMDRLPSQLADGAPSRD